MNIRMDEEKTHETQWHTILAERWAIILVISIICIYSRSLLGGFVWDDRTWFVDNDILPNLNPWDLKKIFLSPASYWGENLPLSELLFTLEYKLFGLFTPGYHAVSILLYVSIAMLVRQFLVVIYDTIGRQRQHNGEPPVSRHKTVSVLLVILIFLLHPVHVEAVAYITAQQHLLYALFSFLAINRCLAAWNKPSSWDMKALTPAILFYYLAILSKYQAISTGIFIPAIWLLLYYKKGSGILKPALVWVGINIPVFIWLLFSTTHYQGISKAGMPLIDSILRGIRIFGAHSLLVLKPFPLSFGYPFEHTWSLDLNFLSGLFVLLWFGIMIIRHQRSIVTVGLLIYVVFFLPMFQILMQISNATVYDRYLFISLLGMCMIFERALHLLFLKVWRLPWIYASISCLLIITLGTLTFRYIPKFYNDVASLEHTYRNFPGWKRGDFDYAYALIEAGELEKAKILIETETSFSQPAWVKDYFNGWICLEKGDVNQAIVYLRRSSLYAKLGGYYPFADVHLAKALIFKNRLVDAERRLINIMNSRIHQPVEFYKAKKLYETIKTRK